MELEVVLFLPKEPTVRNISEGRSDLCEIEALCRTCFS